MAAHRPPGRPRKVDAPRRPASEVAVYQVGRHEVRVYRSGWSWTAAVDAQVLTGRFESLADAWAAGVAAAERLDRPASSELSSSAA